MPVPAVGARLMNRLQMRAAVVVETAEPNPDPGLHHSLLRMHLKPHQADDTELGKKRMAEIQNHTIETMIPAVNRHTRGD
jgi:hypothetical protein